VGPNNSLTINVALSCLDAISPRVKLTRDVENGQLGEADGKKVPLSSLKSHWVYDITQQSLKKIRKSAKKEKNET